MSAWNYLHWFLLGLHLAVEAVAWEVQILGFALKRFITSKHKNVVKFAYA
jgi:hypothetical protein